jgi:diaminopimelate decarboxylase
MIIKKLPFDPWSVREICKRYGTPIYLYDEKGIRETVKSLYEAFSWAPQYKNYFAVKATPTPRILRILYDAGMGFDCSSRTELMMMKNMGISGEDIFFTSNNTSQQDFELAIELKATVNIDDITQVPVFITALSGASYHAVALRYNPGEAHTGNDLIGKPVEAKYGMTLDQLVQAYRQLSAVDIQSFGLHAMVASNERNPEYFGVTAQLMSEAIDRVQLEAKVKIDFVNLGGGFGLSYRPDQESLDITLAAKLIQEKLCNKSVRIFTENGRYVTGPHGYLITTVRYIMKKHKKYIGVDASMHNLMRPGMYGAYHHISVVGNQSEPFDEYDIVGSLCENNDKFAVNRLMPKIAIGDLIVIHDVGAHGHAMGFNYNGLLRSTEVLVGIDGDVSLIRRAETVDDYFATITEW